ncbi:hypothetical protein JRI60_08020 [Archangium violaceum]|nr:hypothetical protein [Archangium violaceum]QRN98964.1 hypothetical protein JRI60_08020 [Archangium violaceum]
MMKGSTPGMGGFSPRRINGGYNGKADRDSHCQRAPRVFGDGSALRSVK